MNLVTETNAHKLIERQSTLYNQLAEEVSNDSMEMIDEIMTIERKLTLLEEQLEEQPN